MRTFLSAIFIYTGHLVCCSVHAPRAFMTLGRMMDLKASTYDLVSVLQAVIYQQLIVDEGSKTRSAHYEILDQEQVKALLLSA